MSTRFYSDKSYQSFIYRGSAAEYFGSVVLLLHGDGTNGSTTFTDNSSYAHSFSALNSAQISTAQSKFGGSALKFDGTTDAIYTADSAELRLGNSDFTLECWFYAEGAGSGTFRGIYAKRNSNATYREASIYIDNANKINFLVTATGSNWNPILTASAINHDQWHHIAHVRNGTTVTAYLNGSSVGTTTEAGVLSSSTEDATIGALGSNGDFSFYGYIDDFRLTKGIARYTANFTPPATPFPNN